MLIADSAVERAARLQEEAERARKEAQQVGSGGLSVGDVVEHYERWRNEQGRKAGSTATTVRRLRAMLGSVWDEPIKAVTATRAQSLYNKRVDEGVAGDTHRNELGEVRTLWRWAGKSPRRWVNPAIWKEVEPSGTREAGKEQLRPTEARLWYDAALREAQATPGSRRERQNKDGALAALCTLLLGYRASEVVNLLPRDVDGGMAWVSEGKTKKSKRHVRICEPLASLLQERVDHVKARGGGRLFPHRREWVLENVQRICKKAGVPRVCAHAMRGLHGTLAIDGGQTMEAVAQQLGHAGTAVTKKHYVDQVALIEAGQRALMDTLGAAAKPGKPSVTPEEIRALAARLEALAAEKEQE